jgi:acetyl esterase/lipase
MPTWLIDAAKARDWIFVTADYRLLFPRNGHDILEDIKDFFLFLKRRLPKRPPGANTSDDVPRDMEVDLDRIIVTGASAGGYLAYLSALWCDPKPKAVASLYGMGGDFFTKYTLDKKDNPFWFDHPLLDPDSPELTALLSRTNPPPVSTGVPPRYDSNGLLPEPRQNMPHLLYQMGKYLDYLTGDHTLSAKLLLTLNETQNKDALPARIPQEHHVLFPQLHIHPSFPPTLLIHGSGDRAVPLHESLSIGKQLKEAGVKCKVVVVDGGDHAFDLQPGHTYQDVLEDAVGWIETNIVGLTGGKIQG